MLLDGIIENILLPNLSCSSIVCFSGVCSSFRSMCLSKALWRSKFKRKNIPLPQSLQETLPSSIKLYRRCKKIYPEILYRINGKHELLCRLSLTDVPKSKLFPQRIRDRILPFFQEAQEAGQREEEDSQERRLQRMHSQILPNQTKFVWFSLSIMLDGELVVKRHESDTKVCFTEKLSREEIELFLLHMILANGPI